MRAVLRLLLSAVAALALLTLLAACAGDRSIKLAEQTVTPVTVGQATSVEARDLAEAMLRAGFSPEQIITDGPAVRNALATSGGAQVRYGKVAEAIFAIHGDELYITSRTRGTFVMPLTLTFAKG
jgi:hypothetical protein